MLDFESLSAEVLGHLYLNDAIPRLARANFERLVNAQALGLKLKCLCINQAFEVGPGEAWYRVIEVQVSKNFRGEGFEIKHAVVGIDKKRKREFERPMSFSASGLG